MPSDTAQRGRPTAMILTAVLLLGLAAAVPAAAAPADPPAPCATAGPKAPCPATSPTCVTPSRSPTKGPTESPAKGTAPSATTPAGGKPAAGATSACPGKKKSGGDDTHWVLIGSTAALLLVLLVLLVVAVRRSGPGRHSAHARPDRPDADLPVPRTPTVPTRLPGARRAPRPETLLPATVATDLHPQGYVEIDACLVRAVWAEPSEPPPGAGDPVDVGRPDPDDENHDPHVLLAFPADLRRRDHAR